MYLNISLDKIRPYVRYGHIIKNNSVSHFACQRAYDCRLFYAVSGSGSIQVEDVTYQMERGSLLLWQPDNKYLICSDSTDELMLLGFNFDFTQNHRHLSSPIPPVKEQNYDKTLILEQLHFTDVDPFNKPIFLKDMQVLEESLLDILNDINNKKLFYVDQISGKFLSVLSIIARSLVLQNTKLRNSNSRIDDIIHYLQMHYPEDITNAKLGELFHYHPNYINKLMTANTGLSLHQYLLNLRINKAIHLIQTTDIPISEIALLVGFHDYNHFLKYFKFKTGRTTSEYRM